MYRFRSISIFKKIKKFKFFSKFFQISNFFKNIFFSPKKLLTRESHENKFSDFSHVPFSFYQHLKKKYKNLNFFSKFFQISNFLKNIFFAPKNLLTRESHENKFSDFSHVPFSFYQHVPFSFYQHLKKIKNFKFFF